MRWPGLQGQRERCRLPTFFVKLIAKKHNAPYHCMLAVIEGGLFLKK